MAYRESTKDCTELGFTRQMPPHREKHERRCVELQNCEDA
jgi:hypothetical protein